MDCVVHGPAKSRTGLSGFHFYFHRSKTHKTTVGAPRGLDFQESLTPKLVYTQLSVFQQFPTSSWPQWVLLLEILFASPFSYP